MGNKLSTEEKHKTPNIGIFFVKYNSTDDVYTSLRITKDNFDNEYKCYLKNNTDPSVVNKDIFVLHNKDTNNFNIVGESDENEKIIVKKYIEIILGIHE